MRDQEPAGALIEAIRGAGPRPGDDAGRAAKKNYDAVEKFEALGILLYRATEPVAYRYFDAGNPEAERPLDAFLLRLLERIAERNPDRFRFAEGRVIPRRLSPVPARSDQADDSDSDEDE